MKKLCLPVIFFIGLKMLCLSQDTQRSKLLSTETINKLKSQLPAIENDSDRIEILQRIGFSYERVNIDSTIKYYNEGLSLARKRSYGWGESRLLASMSGLMEHQGRFAEAFDLLFKALKIAEENHSTYDIARANRRIGGIYFELEYYRQAVDYLIKAIHLDEAGQPAKVAIDQYALADAYEKMNKLDSATYYITLALQQAKLLPTLMQYVYSIDGHIKQKKGDYEQAALSYRQAIDEAQKSNDFIGISQSCADFSGLYKQLNQKDSAIFYALKGIEYGREVFKKGTMLNGNLLAALYDSSHPALALRYYKMAAVAKDSLYGISNLQAIQDLTVKEQARQKELENAKEAYRNKLKLYGLLSGITALLLIAVIQYRNNRQKQKANKLLQLQKQKIETTLNELKHTQKQLIQSEKMASLGELTAGIAHEIQNPLNFVNNFSEVNKELIEELKSKNEKLKIEDEEINDLLNDIKSNSDKISLHGKRAEAIVKGMLQHSRTSSGQKEFTDINALCDEYLRLAYHGLRAKDKTFNATLQTDFDSNIGKINIIPQDIGRVILNLVNNAFYAVNEKEKTGIHGYEPIVTVSTRNAGNMIEILVEDNGNGIPQNIIDKIFQPFFTTKPTGQGTGLGLSLSYDIIKAHGGELTVNTTAGKGSVFIIALPLQ